MNKSRARDSKNPQQIIIKKINNEVVKAVPLLEPEDNRPVLGANLFPEIYANIFLCARKKSGKSSVIYNIIKKCADKNTTIVAFVSTLHKDKNWATIQLHCELNNIPFIGYTIIFDDDDGHDVLDELVAELSELNDINTMSENLRPENAHLLLLCDDEEDEKEIKPRKSKYQVPEYIFIFDDLSTELKSRSLTSLLKKNRHIRCKIIISSQYLNDLAPQSRKQLDYFLIFKGQPQAKLDEIYRDADIHVSKKLFYNLYQHASHDKFSFLYVDTVNSKFRRNFNQEYTIPENINI